MTNIVFLEPSKMNAEPFTTSDVIAEFAVVQHHTITRLIRNHKSDFEEFGRVGFEIQPLQTNGGVQDHKIFRLNEEQATLLMTYLKNTEQVRAFKKELVRQFYAMRRELLKRQVNRAKMLPTRRDMTDAIRDCIPDSPHKAMWFKHYTDLAYRAAFGKTAAQIRKERGATSKAIAADYLTSEEMAAVDRVSRQIGVLVEMRLDYQTIKEIVLGCKLAKNVS